MAGRIHPAVVAAAFLVAAPALAAAGEMRPPVKIDWAHPRAVQVLFGSYGYRGRPCVFLERDGFRLALPAAEGVPQTGVYSTFVLAGDCEAVVTYEVLALSPPTKGSGAGLGVAFDVGEGAGWGSIQRVSRVREGGAYVLQATLPSGGQAPGECQVVPTKARQGRIGLRRVGKELIFLAADKPTAEPEEIGRLPFTERTIRTLHLFADPGGSPTAVDVRLREIAVRAEEATGGIPKADAHRSRGWWLLVAVPVVGAALLLWLWRWRRAGAEECPAAGAKSPHSARPGKGDGSRSQAITPTRGPKP